MKCSEPSYVLFSRFIALDHKGDIDVTGLLTRACYEAWLQSREIFPRLPEESFRKALTSHCKGAAGMKPFSPQVEKEVLEMLRQRRVWPCFAGTDIKIGIRGCHLKGYWESIESQAEINPNAKERTRHREQIGVDCILPVEGCEVKKKRQRTSIAGDIPYFKSKVFSHNEKIYGRKGGKGYTPPDVMNKSKDSSQGNVKGQPGPTEIASLLGHLADFVQKNDALLKDGKDTPSKEQLQEILDRFSAAMDADGFVKERLGIVFEFLPKKHLLMFLLTLYKQTGFSTLFPQQQHANEGNESDDTVKFFLSPEFCIPAPADRKFKPNRPVGICLGDFATYTVVDADENSRKIYRGSIVGMQSIMIRVHKFQSTMYLHEQLSQIFTTGEAWTRSIEYRCDKTVMVLLNRYVMVDPQANCVRVEHQDVTDEFAHLL